MKGLTALLWLMLLSLISPVLAIEHSPVPGGVVRLTLDAEPSPKPSAHYAGRPVWVVATAADEWQAIIGIPLSTPSGQQQLELQQGERQWQQSFAINGKEYPSQHITVKNRRHVTPNPDDLTRIRRERKQMDAALGHWRPDSAPLTPWIQPVAGRLSSPFGFRRFFNGQPRNPHSGLDIAAPTGTPIVAPAAGQVILTGDFFFNGQSVFIDHGNGVISLYCHLDRIDVVAGDQLAQGDPLGTIGQTGRATGPHLHWGISLNDVRVDPSLWINLK